MDGRNDAVSESLGRITPTGTILHVIVHGKVQGVGFRWFVRTEARRLGLAGWVRNLPDGTVEVRASGIAQFLASLEQAIQRGPEGATVSMIAAVETAMPDSRTDTPYPFVILR
jgi:acylphosphatase